MTESRHTAGMHSVGGALRALIHCAAGFLLPASRASPDTGGRISTQNVARLHQWTQRIKQMQVTARRRGGHRHDSVGGLPNRRIGYVLHPQILPGSRGRAGNEGRHEPITATATAADLSRLDRADAAPPTRRDA